MTIPPPLQHALLGWIQHEIPVAWLRVDSAGALIDSDGNLAHFGLAGMSRGALVRDHDVFLEVLAAPGPVTHIDSLHLANDEYADVRVLPDGDDLWIVLIGKTAETRWRGIAQQKSNELTLLQDRISKQLHKSDYLDLGGLMGILALEPNRDGSFRVLPPIPANSESIYPATATDQLSLYPDRDFPYLTSFLEDAQVLWRGRGAERIKSGPWVEVAPGGEEYALEATAILWQERQILVLERLGGTYQERLAILQHGRENLLIKRQLEHELAVQKELELKLLAERTKADRASQAKSEFVSAMSHELRTPLNAILGFAQVLKADPANPMNSAQQTRVNHILGSGRHLLDLINEVLELSRIEAGEMELSMVAVRPSDAVNAVLPIVRVLAEKQGVSIAYEPLADTLVNVDTTRLKQVMINLINNAVKYNQRDGRVTISEQRVAGERVRISVVDTGFGIPANRQAELFTPFSRLGRENSNIEGAGVGLAVTKTIIDKMGGSISFESVEGVGSTFWIELPVHQGTTDHQSGAASNT